MHCRHFGRRLSIKSGGVPQVTDCILYLLNTVAETLIQPAWTAILSMPLGEVILFYVTCPPYSLFIVGVYICKNAKCLNVD